MVKRRIKVERNFLRNSAAGKFVVENPGLGQRHPIDGVIRDAREGRKSHAVFRKGGPASLMRGSSKKSKKGSKLNSKSKSKARPNYFPKGMDYLR